MVEKEGKLAREGNKDMGVGLKSRHTPAKGLITRSLGIEEGVDFVVGIHEDGYLLLREEPVGRRLGRNELVPEKTVDLQQLRDASPEETKEAGDAAKHVLLALYRTLPLADFGIEVKEGYKVKTWLMRRLEALLQEDQAYLKVLAQPLSAEPTEVESKVET
jgi:hypothetical protein